MNKNSTYQDGWFTEDAAPVGSRFSLSVHKKLHEEQTPFQFLEIYQTTHYGNLMVLDGYIMLSQRDNFIYHEMLSHPVLFSHIAPKKVAIIGGGDCGTLREVLKHDCVEHVWQIDIDERVTRNAERYFPELCRSNNDPRAELLFLDGIKWMAQAESDSLDIIIVDSTDPVGPGAGLFREPFYRDCCRALTDGGLIVQQSESPLADARQITYPMREIMASVDFQDVQTLFFPAVLYPTGWWSATVAVKNSRIHFARRQDAESKPFATDYYNARIHEAAFAVPEFFAQGRMIEPIK